MSLGHHANEISQLGLVCFLPAVEERPYMSVFLGVSDVSKMDVVAEGAVGIANLEFGGQEKSVAPNTRHLPICLLRSRSIGRT